jgi:rhodanese-related sulfurtransferase
MATKSCCSPAELNHLANEGYQILDVREAIEFSQERLSFAQHIPLGELERRSSELDKAKPVVVMCRSGVRGEQAQAKLQTLGFTNVVNLEGGILACRSAGLAIESDGRRGLPLMQQVQLTIGLCVVTGSILALTVNPLYALIPAFFGSGLIFAGSTGWCGLALLMAKMPWNAVAKPQANCCR